MTEPLDGIPDESQVIALLRAGDRVTFATLVNDYSGRLLALSRRMLRDDHDAQEAVQEAFLQVFRAVGAFEARSSLYTWMHRITVRVCLMRLRKMKGKERPIEELLPAFHNDGHRVDTGPAWKIEPSDDLIAQETRQLVRAAIDELPDAYRQIVILRDIEEMETQEVAELLEVSEGVVKTRLHRARQALRTILDKHFARRK